VNGKRLRFTFTFWVSHRDGREEVVTIVEKKRDMEPNTIGEYEPPRWNDLKEWSFRRGYECRFLLRDTAQLKNRIMINNWVQVLPFVARSLRFPNPDLTDRVQAAVESHEVLTLADLPRVFPTEDPEELVQRLFHLVHNGKVRIDLTHEAITQAHKVEPIDANL
jgi:hypothetical protein